MDPVAELVAFVRDLRFEDLPSTTVAAVKVNLADAVACALAGSAAPLSPEIVERHVRWGGAPEATVLVYGHRLPAPTAAWLNAAMIHAHDFDDSHRASNQHVFVALLPAALATAESLGEPISGRDLITTLAAAAELQIRLGLSVLPHMHVGWLPTAVFGGLGAAAASGKLLGLTAAGLANAIGLAYAQAQGNRQGLLEGNVAKRLTPAFSARAGVHAAALAEIGVTGPHEITTGSFGLYALFGNGSGDESVLTSGLGQKFAVDEIALKPYPSCRAAHRPIDMALEAKAQLGPFSADAIDCRGGLAAAPRVRLNRSALYNPAESAGGCAVQRTMDGGICVASRRACAGGLCAGGGACSDGRARAGRVDSGAPVARCRAWYA